MNCVWPEFNCCTKRMRQDFSLYLRLKPNIRWQKAIKAVSPHRSSKRGHTLTLVEVKPEKAECRIKTVAEIGTRACLTHVRNGMRKNILAGINPETPEHSSFQKSPRWMIPESFTQLGSFSFILSQVIIELNPGVLTVWISPHMDMDHIPHFQRPMNNQLWSQKMTSNSQK